MNVEVAQRLAELRRKRGYSQESLAHELGLSRQAVSKWERAESSPDTENLIALAKLYGVSLDELLRVDEDVEDDVAFERAERADSAEQAREARERERAAREQDRAMASQATEAAAQASRAAAQAAEAAAAAGKHATEAAAWQASDQTKGPWRSFPYGIVMVILFFILGFAGSFGTSWLVFLTIPIYHWIARIVDDACARGESTAAGVPHAPEASADSEGGR